MRKFLFCLALALVFTSLLDYANFSQLLQAQQHNNILNSENNQTASPTLNTQFPTLSLDSVFSKSHTTNTSTTDGITLLATGDVMLGRAINYRSVTTDNFTWPFEKTQKLLKSSDIAFINLEGPISVNCPVTLYGMIFCADTRSVAGLKYAGITVANLANNHIGNHGQEGIKTTVDLLNQSDILTTGISGPSIKEIKGTKFAFLGYNDINDRAPGTSWAVEGIITKEVAEAKAQADVAVVEFHWGVEYTPEPTQRQQDLAHLAINSGADIVIGNHPHWFQPVEIYRGKPVIYSHGNFVFDQSWSQETKEGIASRYTFYNKKLVDLQIIPVKISDLGQPQVPEGQDAWKIMDKIKTESYKLASGKAK